jgi:hypothetical protein
MRVRLLVTFLLGIFAGACGHPATLEECELIVGRIAELEMSKQKPAATDAALVEEVARTKRAMRDETLQSCVGRRITARALDCVKDADSSDQIIHQCLN